MTTRVWQGRDRWQGLLAGLSLQAVGTKTKVTALSAAEFVGSHTTTVQLAPGRWMYFAKSGAPHYFLVTR